MSIVSTKIPFKGTGKEYIGDDISEIATAVKVTSDLSTLSAAQLVKSNFCHFFPSIKSAIQQCCIQLKSKIVKRLQAREQQERKRSLSRYIPDATGAVYEVLKQMTEEHTKKRKLYKEEETAMLEKVSKLIITKETLKEKLAEHVEQVCINHSYFKLYLHHLHHFCI